MTQRWWVLASVACGTFMATLDSSIVNIALPTFTYELGSSLSSVKWVVVIYLLMITCLLLPMGRLSDQMGRKRIFQTGFMIFILGSALCSVAPQLNTLVFFRAVQAIGAAMLMANGPALITSAFSSKDRGTALGTLSMVVSAGLLTGPSLGGLLITQLGWRSIFWINVPIGFIGISLVHYFVKKDSTGPSEIRFDWAGAILQGLIFMLFLFAIDPPQRMKSAGLLIPHLQWVLVLFLFLVVFLFIKVEMVAKNPLIDLGLLRNRIFLVANFAGFLIFVAFSSISVLMPFFLEETLHFSTQKAGLFMTAIPLTIFFVAPISGRLSDHFGSGGLSLTGALVGVIGLFSMAGLFGTGIYDRTSPLEIVIGLCSIGLATGLFQSPNNNAIMSCVPLNKLGIASALLAMMRNLGLVTGTGLSTSLISWNMEKTGDFISSFHFVLFVAAWVAVGAVFVSLGKTRWGSFREAK